MKLIPTVSIILLTAAGTMLVQRSHAQSADDQLQVARSALKADRKASVAQTMQFTESEGKAFWPLYEQYRAEMDKSAEALVKLVKEYAQLYPNVPDDRAKVMLKELGDLDKKRVETRNSHLKKIEKVLSPAKTLRFAQVERRLDLLGQLEVASNIPLVPIEGRLSGDASAAAVGAEGVPGGAVVLTYELTARVAALDKANRRITLVDAAGFKKSLTAGPEVSNFDQIQVGDELKVTAAEELVVRLAGDGDTATDASVGLVALAPIGAKPGVVMAKTTQATAKVTAIDAARHRATLQFEDGSSRTVPVREDVDLSKRKIGDRVVIRITESLAIQVAKP